jgi:hypothetical protein
MTTAQYQISDFTSDAAATYKAKIDGNSAVAARIAAAFQCYAASTPDMTVKVAAGSLMVNDALTEKAIQTSATITAPVTHPRIDRVVIDQISGVASIITGTEAASPSAPAITAGKIPVAQIALTTSTTAITNALITDERPFVLFPSIAGLTADGAPDAAADYALVWDASAGAMKKVLLNLIGSGTDQVARDQIALTNIRLMLNTAITTGALVQGKQWELATDEWGTSSTNETYTSSTPNYYANPEVQLLLTGGTNIGGMTAGGGLAAAFDGITSQGSATSAGSSGAPSGYGNSTSVGKDWGSGVTKTVTSFSCWSPNDTGFLGSTTAVGIKLQGSSDGSAWTDLYAGTTPSGTAATVNVTSGITLTAYRYHRITINGNGVNNTYLAEVKFYEATAAPDMTLIPPAAVSVSAVPAYMDAYFLWKDDSGSASLGTDLTVELSRDNGTTYTTATLTNLASYDGTYSIIKARASVASQPSGTSMLCRIKTLNNKAQRIAAPALYAE